MTIAIPIDVKNWENGETEFVLTRQENQFDCGLHTFLSGTRPSSFALRIEPRTT